MISENKYLFIDKKILLPIKRIYIYIYIKSTAFPIFIFISFFMTSYFFYFNSVFLFYYNKNIISSSKIFNQI